MRSKWLAGAEHNDVAPTPPGPREASSPLPYRGELGKTRRRPVRVRSGDALISVDVYISVNADSDPELGRRARGELPTPLHTLRVAGEEIELAIPLRYHEPSRGLFALVLPPVLRHRELEERQALLAQLLGEAPGTPIPDYVLRCPVALGAAGLAALRAVALPAAPEPRATATSDSIGALQSALEAHAEELEEQAPAQPPRLGRERSASDWSGDDERELFEVVTTREDALARGESAPGGRVETATPDTIDEDLSAGLSSAQDALPPGADPVTTEAREERAVDDAPWSEAELGSKLGVIVVRDGVVRAALPSAATADVTALRGPLDVRLVLHRAATYPVVALLLGSPLALRLGRRDQLAALCLDVAVEADRAVVTQLARRFEIVVDVLAAERVARRVTLSAPLADNAAYILRAAQDYRHHLLEQRLICDMSRAKEQALHAGHDLAGANHRSAEQFRDYQLVAVRTAEQLRGALSMIEIFSQPDGEDYLICVRGFPLQRWRRLRRHVLDQAVTWGIWMGPSLANVAISEGLARSRRDLIRRLEAGFQQLRRHPTACDLDDDVLAANAEALAAEARVLGVALGKARTLIDSETDSMVAGTIDLALDGPRVPPSARSVAELLRQLDEPGDRLAAVRELCGREVKDAAERVVAAVARMSRAEAVAGFAHCLRLGEGVELPLISALRSSKSYIRQGAALTLGKLRSERGAAAVVELLLSEPTEIWKELARALAQVGPIALPALARAGSEHGSTGRAEERIAWAMAYLGAREGRGEIAQLATGRTAIAPVAAKALALIEPAGRDQQALVLDAITPEITMNRSFSRQFFAALEDGAGVVQAEGEDGRSQVRVLTDGEAASNAKT